MGVIIDGSMVLCDSLENVTKEKSLEDVFFGVETTTYRPGLPGNRCTTVKMHKSGVGADEGIDPYKFMRFVDRNAEIPVSREW